MQNRENRQQDGRKSTALFLLVFFIFSMVSIILSVLCLGGIHNAFIERNFQVFTVGVCAVIGILCAFSIWATISKRELLIKSLLAFYILLLFGLFVYYILQKTGFFTVIESSEALQTYLQKTGGWMPALYILLQFLQVVILPIPSVVSTVAGVALFGPFRAMIYSLIGILVGSLIAFLIGRKLGYSAVAWLVGEDALKKWQKKLKGKDNLFLTLMFVLPIFPDDLLCLIAGLSSMSTKYFVIVITFSRILGISATCYFVDWIPFNTWWGIVLWGVFFTAIAIAFILVYKNLEKLEKKFSAKKKKR